MAEWLRRLTRINKCPRLSIGISRAGSNPADVDYFLFFLPLRGTDKIRNY